MRAALVLLALLAGLPASAQDEGFRFVVIGHTRGGPGNGIIPRARMAELIDDVCRIAPDFVVLTGDLIYGDINKQADPWPVQIDRAAVLADWEAVDAEFAKFGCPVWRAPGNHDLWEATTRDIWIERYGALHQSFEFGGSRFLLLNSCWTPEPGDIGVCPPRYIRGFPIPEAQREWIRGELAAAAGAEHVFAFMGHMLWWEPDAPWWDEVHPLLAAAPTRAVFAGDLGPWKFSRVERDGVDYVQTAVEFTTPPLVMLRNREESRAISNQLDNFVLVEVEGAKVRYDVRTIGAMTTDRFTPSVYQSINEYDKDTLQRKVYRRMNTPERVVSWLIKLCGAAFAGGLLLGGLVAWLLARRRRSGASA